MRHPFLRTLAGSAATPTDPNFENVTLLLHGDGTNGGQNNTFVDGSTNNFTITRNGNTTQGTFSPYGDNWSNYFDGTGDYLTVPSNTALAMGTGDFTVEFWLYIVSRKAGGYVFATGGQANDLFVTFDTNGNFLRLTNQSTVFAVTGTLSLATWIHIAVVQSSGSSKIYVDGTGGTAVACTINFTSNAPSIGATSTGTGPINGYISNLRVLKGTAQYTANFTPPTAPLTAITNTSLLTCQSNRFRDASTNNFTITRNGDTSVQRFSPFSPTAAYAAGTIGGSGYFDGTNDYLTLPTGQTPLLLGSSDWTFEAWVYRIGNTNTAIVLAGQADLATAAGSSYVFYVSPTATSDVYQSSTGRAVTSPNPTIGQWAHVAWARTGGTYSSYLNGTRVGTVGTLSTTAINDGSTTYAASIGCFSNGNNDFYGYIAGARLIKGSGGYDATSATITVPTSPPTAVTNTSLLLNFTNAAILDNAMICVPETVGNAQIDTTTKKFGTGSMKFDGTGDNLLILSNPDIEFGSGNFTIEFWINFTSVPSSAIPYFLWEATNPASGLKRIECYIYANDVAITYSGTAIAASTSTSWTTGQWYHIALVRNGNSFNIYRDGTSIASGSNSNAFDIASGYTIGDNINGYIDDFRITKGVARYTANFTAPTAAFPDL